MSESRNDYLVAAAVAFRESLVPRADRMEHGQYPLWNGWAIYDAFVAGAQYATQSEKQSFSDLRTKMSPESQQRAENKALDILTRDMARLRAVEHAAWHAMEVSEERDDCLIVPKAEGLALSELLPEEHPGSE